MVVMDASVVLAFALPSEPFHIDATRAINHWVHTQTSIFAPPLLYAELTAVCRKFIFTQRISSQIGDELLATMLQLPIQIYDNIELYQRALTLATQLNQSRAYDTQYLAVAEHMRCPLWTTDARFVNSVTVNTPIVQHISAFVPYTT